MYHFLLSTTRKAIRESGLPSVESFSWDQYGATFSKRLSTSVRKALNQGYEKVIVVGNDAPYLTAEVLLQTEKLLDQGKPVIGADERGGTYLMAFTKDCFKKTDFEAIDWQTDRVFEQLKQQIKPSVLEKDLTDVNDKSDLLRLIESAVELSSQLQQLLKELFAIKIDQETPDEPYCIEHFCNYKINRGPPELLIMPF